MILTRKQKEEIMQIYGLTQIEMARLHRFAVSGHPWFNISLPYHRHFERRFKQLGGMTPAISKLIGWEIC